MVRQVQKYVIAPSGEVGLWVSALGSQEQLCCAMYLLCRLFFFFFVDECLVDILDLDWILCNSPILDLRKGDSNGSQSLLPHTLELFTLFFLLQTCYKGGLSFCYGLLITSALVVMDILCTKLHEFCQSFFITLLPE